MSSGALFGTIMNFFLFAAIWVVIGQVFDKVGQVFNTSMRIMPTMQDAVNGFSLAQTIYGILPIIVLIALVANYIITENSNSTMEV